MSTSIEMSEGNDHRLKGYTRLMSVCRAGNLESVSKMIRTGVELDAQDSDGNTALHYAALSRKIPLLTLLLEQKANPWILNGPGETAFSMEGLPLHQDAHLQNIISDCSVEQKEDEETQKFFQHLYDKVFVPHYPDIRIAADNTRHTALLAWAAAMGNVAEVTRLLSRDIQIDPNTTEMGHKRTALRMACKNRHLAVVQVLLEAGANPNFPDDQGHTPMDFAVASKRDDIVESLRQAKGRPTPEFLKRALIKACKTGDIDSARRLLKQGANPNINETSNDHLCPLTLAGLGDQNQAELVQLLLEHGANPDHPCYRDLPAWNVIRVNQPHSPATPIVVAAHKASQNNAAPALAPEAVHAYPALACERLFAAIKREFPSDRKGVGRRSKMKYEIIGKAVEILKRDREEGKLGTATAEELLERPIPLADLGIILSGKPIETKLLKALYKPKDDERTTLKEILEFHRIRHNSRSKDFFKKPDSAQKILEEFYPKKKQLIEFIESVHSRIGKDKRKSDKTNKMGVLHKFVKEIQNCPSDTELTKLLSLTISMPDGLDQVKTYTLLEALEMNRNPKDEGKDPRSLNDLRKLFPECSEFIQNLKSTVTP